MALPDGSAVQRIADLNRRPHKPRNMTLIRGDTVGYTAGRHFYNLPDGLDMGELCKGSGNSLICNDI